MTDKLEYCSRKAQEEIESCFGSFFENKKDLDMFKYVAYFIEKVLDSINLNYEIHSSCLYGRDYFKNGITYEAVHALNNFTGVSILLRRTMQLFVDDTIRVMSTCQFIKDGEGHTLDSFRDAYRYYKKSNDSISKDYLRQIDTETIKFNEQLKTRLNGLMITYDEELFAESFCSCYCVPITEFTSINFNQLFNTEIFAMEMFRTLSITAESDIRQRRINLGVLDDRKHKGRYYHTSLNPYGEKIIFQGHDWDTIYGVVQDSRGILKYRSVVPSFNY